LTIFQIRERSLYIIKMDDNIVICPHCKDPIIIVELNCCIFRHGVVKSTGEQMDPHLDQAKCDQLVAKNLIYGCGKPFRIIQNNQRMEAVDCEYI